MIRPTRVDETATLREIEVLAGVRFRDVGMPDIADAEPISHAEFAAYIDAHRSWVATDEADVAVGYVVVDRVDDQAHLEQISVRPDCQGRGVGRALVERVCDWAREQDLSGVTLTTFTDVPWNAPLYRHLGFRDLAEDALGAELRRLRDDEAAHGLDPEQRVCMRRET